MQYCSKVLAFAILACSVAFGTVLKFNPFGASDHFAAEMKDLVDFLMKPRTLTRYVSSEVFEQMGLNPRTRLTSYRWDNCGNKSAENFIIHDIKFSPDPISFPGTLSVSFDISLNITITDIVADVLLEKHTGTGWLKFPCIGVIGSCHYDDVCKLLDAITACPDPFVSAGVPCKCPLKKGSYRLPKASFDVDGSFLPPGDYHIQANLTNKAKQNGGCYDIYASFE